MLELNDAVRRDVYRPAAFRWSHARLDAAMRAIAEGAARLRGIAPDERPTTVRLERVLAVGRALVTTSLAVIYAHPANPVPLSVVSYTVLATYALYSLLLLAHIDRSSGRREIPGLTIHAFDLLWIATLTFVHPGAGASFLVLFLFVVLASAYRWGFAGTVLTTGVALALFLGDLLSGGSTALVAGGAGAGSNEVVLAVASLLLTGSLVGYLGAQGKRARAELSALADIAQLPRVRLGVGGSVAAVSRVLARVFDAQEVCCVVEDFDNRDVFFWHLDRHALTRGTVPQARTLDAQEQCEWLFPDPGDVWFHGAGTLPNGRARIKRAGVWAVLREHVTIPPRIAAVAPGAGMVVANIGLASEWRGRIYLLAPARRGHINDALRFLEALVDHAAPALTNVFLLNRLRARVTAAERSRVARELHDGAIQSLLGLDLKMEAVRRTPQAKEADLAKELEEVQSALRQQVLELRTLMQALRPIPSDTNEQLPDVMASIVERFRRDSGITARFVHTGGPASLRSEQALEVVRILQEALVNVRRHSRARNAMVRLTTSGSSCVLVVEDDGIGLGFEGQLSGPELELQRLGPAIIRERARLVGAHLTVESHPGTGLRIELMLEGASS